MYIFCDGKGRACHPIVPLNRKSYTNNIQPCGKAI